MVAMASTDLTITVGVRRQNSTKRRSHYVTIAFGNGALTYPAGGVPFPSYKSFGFARFMDTINLQDPSNADGFIYKYDQTNQKLRIYQGDNTNAAAAPAVELGVVAIAATTVKGEAIGW